MELEVKIPLNRFTNLPECGVFENPDCNNEKKSPPFSKTLFIDMSEQHGLKYNPINSEWQVCYSVAYCVWLCMDNHHLSGNGAEINGFEMP